MLGRHLGGNSKFVAVATAFPANVRCTGGTTRSLVAG
jgi:hypothetical protein